MSVAQSAQEFGSALPIPKSGALGRLRTTVDNLFEDVEPPIDGRYSMRQSVEAALLCNIKKSGGGGEEEEGGGGGAIFAK